MNFAEWIESELNQRGWSRREAARRGGISPSMLDKVISRSSKPGMRFLEGISKAFEVPLHEVVTRSLDEEYKDNLSFLSIFNELLNTMTDEELEEMLAYGRMKIELRRKREETAAKGRPNHSPAGAGGIA
jgi:transcriptional regulator with XRE-family HTH domain